MFYFNNISFNNRPIRFCGNNSTPKDGTTKASILYMNDLHGQNIRMERLYNVVNQFDSFKQEGTDKMKFASGDIMLGEDDKLVKVADKFLNISGIMATALGNHECDMPTDKFVGLIKDKTYKLLGMNMKPDADCPINKYIEKSYIQEINGNKYAIIGLVPPDLSKHVKLQDHLKALNIETNFDNSIKELQGEVDKYRKQGIDKIIVLSHAGYRQDVKLAQNIDGVDIILGAHTHTLLEGIEKDKNLFYSPSGEPIVITQAGRDGEHFGVLNVEFNNKGVITKVQNNLGDTDDFGRSLVARTLFENILGKPEKVGKIGSVEPFPKDYLGTENPHCDFITDALRSELGTDIGVMNSANIRGKFEPGEIDTRDLAIISPFANKVVATKATEEEIVNAVKYKVKASMSSRSHRPGILQVSGLKYSFNSKGELLSMSFVDKNGNTTPIDINNPRKDKFYTIAGDDYCIGSEEGSGLNLPHRLKEAYKKFDFDKDVIVKDYIKHNNKTMDVKSDSRITKVD